MNIRPVGAEPLHVDGEKNQTDGRTYRCDEASSRFSKFC